jgi:hypothetical protein
MQAFGSSNPGCSDNICPGFIQVIQDKSYVLGVVVSPASRVGASDKYVIEVKIQRVIFYFFYEYECVHTKQNARLGYYIALFCVEFNFIY